MQIFEVKHKLLFWVLVTIIGKTTYSVEPFIRKISYLEGLPTQTIYDLFVDQKGYLYLGTDIGLIKYNGVNFNKIPFKGNLALSVNNISQDTYGNIWCKNFSNQIFQLQNDTLSIMENIQNELLNNKNLKEFIVVDNELWIVTQNLIINYNIKDSSYKIIEQINKNDEINMFFDIIHNPKKNTIYYNDINHIYEYDLTNKKTTIIKTSSNQKALNIHQNDLYFSHKGGENKIVNFSKNIDINQTNIKTNTHYNYLRSTEKELWLCSNNGLYLINTNSNEIIKNILPKKRVSDILIDNEGNKWISTLDEGLFFLPNLSLEKVNIDKNSPSEKINFLRLSKGPDQTVFVGSNFGKIYQYNKKGDLINIYDSGINNEIEFIYYDSIHQKVFHTLGYIDLKLNTIDSQISFGKFLSPDEFGNYIISTFNMAGIISNELNGKPKHDFKNSKFNEIKFSTKEINALEFREIRSRLGLYSPIYKKYYISFSDGLFTIDLDGNIEELKLNQSQPIIAFDMKIDKNGFIWISTIHDGMLKIKNNEIIKNISSKDGLSSNVCKKFTFSDENLYVINNGGIDKIKLDDHSVKKVSQTTALKGININDILVMDKTIWLATSEGILFFPADMKNHFVSPKLYIDKLWVKGEEDFDINKTLSYNENDIEIKLDVVHYSSLGDWKIQHRLLGYDTSWQELNSSINRIKYLSLPPGEYIFQAQAFIDENKSETVEIKFKINSPFWVTWWFISLIFILLIYLFYSVYKIAVKKTHKKQLIREKLAMSQLTALRSQMNPHFIFNVLNAVQGLIFANKKNDATEYLGKFSDLMRRTLENSDKQIVSLSKEIETLTLYIEIEAARFENNFFYQIEIDKSIDVSDIQIPSMIIQPYVENAIKHGLLHKKGEKNINIYISYSNNQEKNLKIIIDDNGIGRKASKEINLNRNKHTSFATAAIESRVYLLNKILKNKIEIETIDKENSHFISMGTRVIISIPNEN